MTEQKKLEEAKRLYHSEGTSKDQKYVLERLFPELIEEEDERIRKALINLFKIENFNGYTTLNGIDVDDVIAWLEKQGEQKTKWGDDDEKKENVL